MERKPYWIEILSDNKPGEAKTTVDSYYAQIAIKDIRGMSVANINPGEQPKKTKKTISTLEGITNWLHFVWPTSGKLLGYICACSLPNFGSWNTFLPIDIKKTINNQEFTKPDPKISNCTIPNSEWTIPLSSNKSKDSIKTELKKRKIVHDNKENKCDLVALLQKDIGKEIQKKCQVICSKNNQEKIELKPSYFDLEWALRECQEYDIKNRFTASMMLKELQKKVKIGELEADEIPKIKIPSDLY
ncbi:hypothetical protein C2G38_2208690 [Gigaspora rosea]|uniref:Uncharacterized protein n=1 Tax=Gigaspora rosea TaxID=44941 RepID=A0A397UHF1_9GLOM|nr:hypothetical protein C2G38_2208690 [Gigaspora rosea]